jgi:glycosyltransferase involved in cell wall biosynthesis
LHLTSKVFSPRGHPGIYRTVTSLVPHATNVIFCAEKGAYSHLPLSPEEDAALRAQGVHHYPLRLGDLTRPTVIRRFLAGLRRRHGRPAAVIGHLGNNGWRAIPLAKRAGIPILTTFHGTDVTVDLNSEKFGWRYQRLRQAPAARWLTVAAHLAERLIAWGIAPEQVATHHLPVDLPPQGESERQRSSALRLALVGRMIPVKGHSVAFEALQRVLREHPDTTLTLYGDGPLEQDLRRDVANRGLERAVAFAGSIPAEKLRAALVDAHVVLQPSRIDAAGVVEGLPNSVLEAMATGLPVIGPLHGGIVDAVQHGVTGLLVPEGDAPALADAILRLEADEALRRQLGRAGRLRVEEEFSVPTRGRALAAQIETARRDYQAMPRRQRAEAWQRAIVGLHEPESLRSRAKQELLVWHRGIVGAVR